MSFDEQPDGDPHGECAAEIHRLEQEIERLQETLAATIDINEQLRRERDDSLELFSNGEVMIPMSRLAASQSREAALREALHNCYGNDEDGVEYVNYTTIKQALSQPQDDTALRTEGGGVTPRLDKTGRQIGCR